MKNFLRLSGLVCGWTVACGGAMAQSSVSIYGLVDVYAGKKQLASPTGVRTFNVDGGGMTTSYWGFRGTEDMGDGLIASFDISGFFRPDSGDVGRVSGEGVFTRSSWVGLQGDWGTFRMGRMSSPNLLLAIRLSPFTESTSLGPYLLHTYVGGQPLNASVASGGLAGVSDSGYSNAVTYFSPRISGFQGGGSYSFGEVPSNASANQRLSYSLTYESGSLFAGYSGERVHAPTMPAPPAVPIANQKSQQNTDQLGATYDFGFVKVFAAHSRTHINLPPPATRHFRTSQLGASVLAGSTGRILLSMAKTSKTETAMGDERRSTFSAGYDYFLSKRTDLYLVAMRDEVTNMKTGVSVVAGIRHRF